MRSVRLGVNSGGFFCAAPYPNIIPRPVSSQSALTP